MSVDEKPAELISSRHHPDYQVTLYEHVGVENSWTLEYYLGHGGYEAAKKVITTMSPEEVVNEVKASGLRGRGGAGFPTGVKWSFMPKPDGKQRFIVCNCDESEPGSFKDRYIVEDDPHQLIEGLLIAGHAIHATKAVIYIRGEYYKGYERLVEARAAALEKGYLGENLFGTDHSFDVIIHRGAGAYICGEETALMNSFEGLRGNPRMKPPFPAQAGVYGKPSTINNVTSITSTVHIINKGAAWFSSMGTAESKGTKLYQISGPVNRPGVYEMPMGATFGELIYDFAGGPSEELKAFIPGGSSTPLLPFTEEYLNTSMSYEGISQKGSMLGTGGVIVIPKEKCIVDFMWNCIRFYAHESCGKCTPCREGVGTWMPQMFKKLVTGRGEVGDLEKIENLAQQIEGTSFCVHADAAMWPINGSIKYFRDEYEYLIEHGVPKYPRTTWWKD